MKPLVDLTSRALARLIEGKTPEQARNSLGEDALAMMPSLA